MKLPFWMLYMESAVPPLALRRYETLLEAHEEAERWAKKEGKSVYLVRANAVCRVTASPEWELVQPDCKSSDELWRDWLQSLPQDERQLVVKAVRDAKERVMAQEQNMNLRSNVAGISAQEAKALGDVKAARDANERVKALEHEINLRSGMSGTPPPYPAETEASYSPRPPGKQWGE